jgi:hypothetical protein
LARASTPYFTFCRFFFVTPAKAGMTKQSKSIPAIELYLKNEIQFAMVWRVEILNETVAAELALRRAKEVL